MNFKKVIAVLFFLTLIFFVIAYQALRMSGMSGDRSMLVSLMKKYSENMQSKEERIHRQIDAVALEQLQVETNAVDIEILATDQPSVQVELVGFFVFGNVALDEALQTKLENKTLVITMDEQQAQQQSPSSKFNLGPKRLVIHVPATLKHVMLRSNSGGIEVRDSILMRVEAQTSAGQIDLREVTVQSAQLRSQSADLTIQGTIEDVQAQSDSGDVYADFTNTSIEGLLKSGSGGIRVNFRRMPTMKIDTHLAKGELFIEDELKSLVQVSKNANSSSNSNPNANAISNEVSSPRKLRLSTESGDISLTQE